MRMGAKASTCTPSAGEAFCFTNVSHQPLIVLTFDRPLAPTSEFRDNYAITSGTSGNLAFKRVRIDPVERAAVLALADTTVTGPDAKLLPNTEYRLVIKSSDDPRNRLASFEGAKFDGAIVRFTTRADATTDLETQLDPAPVDACEAIKVLTSKCSGLNCHGGENIPPALGLSLLTYEAMEATAFNQRSAEVQTAQHPPPGPAVPSPDFPYGMAIIEKGSSARSFLLYKILMDERRTATASGTSFTVAGPPEIPGSDVTASTDPLVSTAKELRRRIPGSEMPPERIAATGGAETGFNALSLAEVRLIRRWIDANTPACTTPSGDAGGDAANDAATDAVSDSISDAPPDAPSDSSGGG